MPGVVSSWYLEQKARLFDGMNRMFRIEAAMHSIATASGRSCQSCQSRFLQLLNRAVIG